MKTEIATKFRETEIGTIPEEWQSLELYKFTELAKDAYLPRQDENIPYIGLEHINQQTLSINSIGKSTDVTSNKFRFRDGDILFGKLRPYFRKVYRPRFAGICSTDIWVARAKTGFDQNWLFWLFASEDFVNSASGGSSGTRMPRADWDHLKDTVWSVPELSEQKQIAEILSSLDDKIELNRKINANLESLASSLFKKWFVDIGDELPKGWESKPLDEVADFLNGLALQKYPAESETDYLPVIKIRELNNGITDMTDKASTKIPSEYILKNGDIVFSWSGSLDVVIWCSGRGALNQHLFKVTSDRYPKWFYYQWIRNFLPTFQGIASDKAVTMGHIKRGHLTESIVLVPDEQSLSKMDELMSPIIETVINNSVEIQNLMVIRDSFLPRLMSGKIRVNI